MHSPKLRIISCCIWPGMTGDTVLNSHSLALPALVTLPVFGKGLRCFRATYRIVGVILHGGSRPGEGQHTAILCSGTTDDRDSCWVVQNGLSAVRQDHTAHASSPTLLCAGSHQVAPPAMMGIARGRGGLMISCRSYFTFFLRLIGLDCDTVDPDLAHS